jgi:hypothetical protein
MEQNMTDAQLVKKSFAFYGGRMFITEIQNPTARPIPYQKNAVNIPASHIF